MTGQHPTRSRYIAGKQCPRRLWLLVHEPPPRDDPASGSPPDMGLEIGCKAQLLFPAGVRIEEEPWRHAETVHRTASQPTTDSLARLLSARHVRHGRVHRALTAMARS